MSIEEVLKDILEAIKSTGFNAKYYLGELSSYKEPELIKSQLPIVFVDYTGDTPSLDKRVIHINLYFVDMTASKTEEYRQNALQSLLQIQQKTELVLINILKYQVDIKKTKKIFDAKTDTGYLTIFTKSIDITIPDEERYICNWTK